MRPRQVRDALEQVGLGFAPIWQNGHGGKTRLDRKLKAIGDAARKTAAATTLADVAK
jgi:hypothetical protein